MVGIRTDCKKRSHPREHWTKKKGNWKPKRCFASIDEAKAFIVAHHMDKYNAYKCPVCEGIHIGYQLY